VCMKLWPEVEASIILSTSVTTPIVMSCIPPYILYKAKHLYRIWTLHGPDGSQYGVSTSGWMEDLIVTPGL
jgi:hypothetical protein